VDCQSGLAVVALLVSFHFYVHAGSKFFITSTYLYYYMRVGTSSKIFDVKDQAHIDHMILHQYLAVHWICSPKHLTSVGYMSKRCQKIITCQIPPNYHKRFLNWAELPKCQRSQTKTCVDCERNQSQRLNFRS
jgi:hypothetical protein